MNTNRHLDALGDPTRRAIFELVARSPQPVGEIAASLPVSRPAVSQHLKVLKDAGLISVRRYGGRNVYAANPSEVALLRARVEQFWRDALVSYKELAESQDTLQAKEQE